MKLITKNSQIVVGGVYNLIDKKNCSMRAHVTVNKIERDAVFTTGDYSYCAPEDPDSGFYWELISYPPRRPVTWELVKENIDQVPGLKVWHQHRQRLLTVNSARKDGLYLEGGAVFSLFVREVLYIDPPHPDVPDVPAPWEVKAERKPEPDPEKKSLWWVENEGGRIFLYDIFCSEEQFKKEFRLGVNRIQPVTRPVHEGPDENAWRSV